MFTQKFSRFFQILVAIALAALVLTQVGTLQVSAQSSVPTVSTYAELPQRGQLIIPPGSQFVVPAEWDQLNVTIWRGMGDPTVDKVVEMGNSIAEDRADRYGGSASDYQTVLWDKNQHPLPGFRTRQSCDDSYGHDAAVLVAGVSVGDAGCYEMIEYDQTLQQIAVAPTIAATSTAATAVVDQPTLISTATLVVSTSTTVACDPPAKPNEPSGYSARFNTATCQWDFAYVGLPPSSPSGGVNLWPIFWLGVVAAIVIIALAIIRRPAPQPVKKVEEKTTTTTVEKKDE